MVRTKYEKYEILLARPQAEETKKLSINHDNVKKHRSVYLLEKTKTDEMTY